MSDYYAFFSATAAVFAGLWALFVAFCIFMSQQRATTGAKLTYATALTPARALIGNAYFFAGMVLSLINLLPKGDAADGARLYGFISSMFFGYAPLAMLYSIARKEGAKSRRNFWKGSAGFYMGAPLLLIGVFWYASDHAAKIVFSLLCFGCVWTLMASMWLLLFPNEWSAAAADFSTDNAVSDQIKGEHRRLQALLKQLSGHSARNHGFKRPELTEQRRNGYKYEG